MTRSRLHPGLLALCALIAVCFAAPASATLTLSNPAPLSGGSFYLTLSSDEVINGVDDFTLTLTYVPDGAATLTAAELGPGLPPFVAFPDPGWNVAFTDSIVQATYVGFDSGVLPVGELVKLTFAAPTQAVMIKANLAPSNILDGPLPTLDSNVVAVPEPSSWLLLAGGLGALSLCARRRRKQHRFSSSQGIHHKIDHIM